MKQFIVAIGLVVAMVDLRVLYNRPTEGFFVSIREPGQKFPSFSTSCVQPGPCLVQVRQGALLVDDDGNTRSIVIGK